MIKPPAVKIYNEGECWICKKPCNPEAYGHFECCLAYAEHREMKQMEINKKNDN